MIACALSIISLWSLTTSMTAKLNKWLWQPTNTGPFSLKKARFVFVQSPIRATTLSLLLRKTDRTNFKNLKFSFADWDSSSAIGEIHSSTLSYFFSDSDGKVVKTEMYCKDPVFQPSKTTAKRYGSKNSIFCSTSFVSNFKYLTTVLPKDVVPIELSLEHKTFNKRKRLKPQHDTLNPSVDGQWFFLNRRSMRRLEKNAYGRPPEVHRSLSGDAYWCEHKD